MWNHSYDFHLQVHFSCQSNSGFARRLIVKQQHKETFIHELPHRGLLFFFLVDNFRNTGSNVTNTKNRVWPHFQTSRRELKIRCVAKYLWRTSRCLEIWSDTVLSKRLKLSFSSILEWINLTNFPQTCPVFWCKVFNMVFINADMYSV